MLARPFRLVPSLTRSGHPVARSLSRAASGPESSMPAVVTEIASPDAQSPNYPTPWSTSQRPRPMPATSGPRFEQTVMELQPAPLSAMELIANTPVITVQDRRAVCDGGLCLTLPCPQLADYRCRIQVAVLLGIPRSISTWYAASLSQGLSGLMT